jgi:hypothetical protein
MRLPCTQRPSKKAALKIQMRQKLMSIFKNIAAAKSWKSEKNSLFSIYSGVLFARSWTVWLIRGCMWTWNAQEQ